MKNFQFGNLGGMKFTQERADFWQNAFLEPFSAIAKLCGNKVIVSGVVSDGTNVSDGFIVYQDELIRFIGCPIAAQVVITVESTPVDFEVGTPQNIQKERVATLGNAGAFPFTDLVPLLSLQNTWRPNDLKQKCVDLDFYNTNYDAQGYGLGSEKGWRVFSKQFANAAGKALVNFDPNDADFALQNTGGTKSVILTQAQLPNVNLTRNVGKETVAGGTNNIRGNSDGNYQTETISLGGQNHPHNNMQPFFVVLTLIKL